jgi:hypothetical protein
MTPAQLHHLAEQADFAAGFYAVTNPSAARRFAETATTARRLSEQLERRQQLARLRAEPGDIRERLNRRALARQALDPFASPIADSQVQAVRTGVDV